MLATPISVAQSDLVKDLIATVLAKIEGIERSLQDVLVLKEQLLNLLIIKAQLTSLDCNVQQSLGAIEAKTKEFASSRGSLI